MKTLLTEIFEKAYWLFLLAVVMVLAGMCLPVVIFKEAFAFIRGWFKGEPWQRS